MDVPLKDYIDAQDEKTRAQNDAQFARVLAKLDALTERINDTPSLGQIILVVASAVAGAVGLVFAILSFSADRFDGGLAASGLLDQMRTEQAGRDAEQDAQFAEILERLDALAAD